MIGYFDTSALAMLVLLDDGWRDLARRVDLERLITAHSDFGWGELISAISLRLRRGAFTRAQADDTLDSAGRYVANWDRIECASGDLAHGTRLVGDFSLKLAFPDAIHVAIASRTGATLVTADARQAAAARAIGLSVLNPLEEPR